MDLLILKNLLRTEMIYLDILYIAEAAEMSKLFEN